MPSTEILISPLITSDGDGVVGGVAKRRVGQAGDALHVEVVLGAVTWRREELHSCASTYAKIVPQHCCIIHSTRPHFLSCLW